MFKSRNTMVVLAVFFLILVVLLRLAGGFLGNNIERIVAIIFKGGGEEIPLVDFSSIDLANLNPMNWSPSDITKTINNWLHDLIDNILPAVIYTFNLSMIHIYSVRKKYMLTTGAVSALGGSL